VAEAFDGVELPAVGSFVEQAIGKMARARASPAKIGFLFILISPEKRKLIIGAIEAGACRDVTADLNSGF
jgi:hypothetical protein